MVRVTNLTSRPQVLSDGTVLAAAGTDGASKVVSEFSDRDRKRLVPRGYVHVAEEQGSGVGDQDPVKAEGHQTPDSKTADPSLNPPPAAPRRRVPTAVGKEGES